MFIDTHCHLDLPPLYDNLPQVLHKARAAGVDRFLVPGVAPEGWTTIRSMAEADSSILPAFGIHPMLTHLADTVTLRRLDSQLDDAVAVGEIGLDYTVGEPSRDVQQLLFRTQLRMAVEHRLPVLIHCRRAFADLLRIMGEEQAGKVGGLMHGYSGSPEVARECIKHGFYISVCGTVTYANAVRPLRVVREIPLERLVLETDAPDISPEPFRGSANEPANILQSARVVASIKGIPLSEVATATTANAMKALNLRGRSSARVMEK